MRMKSSVLVWICGSFSVILISLFSCTANRSIGAAWQGSGPERVEGGVLFRIENPKAARVNIAGDFNGWSSTSDALYDREGNGVWTIVLPLKPGRYEYKFVIDGKKWIHDPSNPARVKDGFGGYNSVVTVEP